ncbi:MAG TPA: HlyD family efflux transporter periplasmic adaptor subunit [Lacipirellulaceae bacterium]|jgi:multidrug resistance efflux pump|nr:HlyD family efflux transporter periplasmic adaptor subunit [Lacipirellulaceae bacterium]
MEEKRIPLAWTVRWRRIRSQTIPIACFAAALFASGWLWRWHGASVQGIGEVDGLRVDITSPTAGLVIALPSQTRGQWTVFDRVTAGDTIARIDDQQLEATKSLLRRDVKDLIEQVKQLQQQQSETGAEVDESVRRALAYEQSRLQAIEQLASTPAPVGANEARPSDAAPPELSDQVAAETRDEIVRMREARRALDVRWEELSLRTGLLEIPAPISGTLVNVYCWPGQIVHPGGLIATIAADHGQHIVGYVPEHSTIEPKVGMRVTLRARLSGAPRLTSEIEEVGRMIEQLPSHQRAVANIPQWGLPVRIKMPSEAALKPGALVDIVFHTADAR